MISRQDALKREHWFHEFIGNHDDLIGLSAFHEDDLINHLNNIYDSIGSCSECKYGDKQGEVVKCGFTSYYNNHKHFCADFQRK